MLAVHPALQIDKDRLARRDVALELVAGAFQRDRLARHHHFATLACRPITQRAYAERIAERQQTMPGDQCHDGIRAAQTLMHRAHRGKDVFG